MKVWFYFAEDYEDRKREGWTPSDEFLQGPEKFMNLDFLPRIGECINVEIDDSNLEGEQFIGRVTDIWHFYKHGKHDHAIISAKRH